MKKNKKIISFFVTLVVLTIISWTSSFGEEKKKYPPYPDVWGYEFPWPGNNDRDSSIRVSKMEDGDYLVVYVKKRLKIKRKDGSCCDFLRHYEGKSFFSGKTYTEEQYKKMWQKDINTGQHVVLDDGSVIEQKTEGLTRCANPLDRYIIKRDKDKNVVAEKMLLYFYDKPIKTDIDLQCERNWSYRKKYLLKRIENVYAFFVPLENGSFLLCDKEGNIVIRFDKYFRTGLSLMNNQIFLINRSEYSKIYEERSKLSKIDDQTMNDAISRYLISLKKEGKK